MLVDPLRLPSSSCRMHKAQSVGLIIGGLVIFMLLWGSFYTVKTGTRAGST